MAADGDAFKNRAVALAVPVPPAKRKSGPSAMKWIREIARWLAIVIAIWNAVIAATLLG